MHVSRTIRGWITVAAVAMAAGCGQNSLGDPTGSTCPADSKLTYETFGKAFFAANCLECHASKESPQFNTLEQIQASKDEIDRAAAAGPKTTNTYMPDGADVSDADRKKLGEWLACGAP
ncbi:MAG TPA: cytochrome c [Polyangiaceae bacterium]|jgi:mono/diheme cytochrome c family protein|nr:cytochrome c [Polyangiaceae bacterium]